MIIQLILAISLVLGYGGLFLYRLFLHPLRSFPGPVTHRISRLPRILHTIRGDLAFHVADLHARYGSVVRLSPNELAFCEPRAWKDIYGHQDRVKPASFYHAFPDTPTTLINAKREEHAALRRCLGVGFSDRNMRAQEPIIGSYVDLLVRRLGENASKGPLNMREWLNWATFDIIGDLGFGSSFGCLEGSSYNPWVALIAQMTMLNTFIIEAAMLGFRPVIQWILRSGFHKKRDEHRLLVKNKFLQRMELTVERADLIEGLLKKKEELNLSVDQLMNNASNLIIAGSETTATLLCGTTFLLATNPDALSKVTSEVRSTFKNDSDITLSSVANLPYMLACLNEALRRYPPVPNGLPRISPGTEIGGHFVPKDTIVAVWQWAINHSPDFWTDPFGYYPERFMKDPRFAGDKLEAMQAFSVGPRNCIGINLAYAEMRLILAKILFNFDIQIADSSRDWIKQQRVYTIWEKPALYMKLQLLRPSS
ncbi:cytochrome P450 [Trichoderma camerunense]